MGMGKLTGGRGMGEGGVSRGEKEGARWKGTREEKRGIEGWGKVKGMGMQGW